MKKWVGKPTGRSLISDIGRMITLLQADKKYGPYHLIISTKLYNQIRRKLKMAAKRKAETKKAQHVSKYDRITAAIMQDVKDLATQDIVRRRTVLLTEASMLDSEIFELSARMADVKDRRAKNSAALMGLGLTIGKR